jgi:hypothetical protein
MKQTNGTLASFSQSPISGLTTSRTGVTGGYNTNIADRNSTVYVDRKGLKMPSGYTKLDENSLNNRLVNGNLNNRVMATASPLENYSNVSPRRVSIGAGNGTRRTSISASKNNRILSTNGTSAPYTNQTNY